LQPLQPGAVPFIYRVNAALQGGWLGGAPSQSPNMLSAAAPPQKTAEQVESLRAALRLRLSASSSNASKTQLQPNSSAGVRWPSDHAERAHNRSPPSSVVENVTMLSRAPASAMQLARDGRSSASAFLKTVKWMNDEDALRCCECNAAFTVFNRRHHCRVCGRLVDSRCCSKFYINNTIVNHSVGVASDIHRIVELVCYPCQKDIERGVPLEHAARNREGAWHSTRADGGPTRDLSELDQYSLHVRPGQPSSGTPASAESAISVDSEGRGHFVASGSPHTAWNPGVSCTHRQRRDAVCASPSLDTTSLHMQLSDLHHDAVHSASNDLLTRELPAKQGLQFGKNAGHRLPSRAFRDGVHPSGVQSEAARHDQFARARAVLDSIGEDCADAALVSLVAGQIYRDAFVEWAALSLGLPSHVAASAAAAAYRQTDEARQAAMHGSPKIPRAGVPRSLFPMLLLNLKLELQRQEIWLHAENSLGSKAFVKKLPKRMKGGSSAISESSLQREQGPYAWSNRTADHSRQGDLQVGNAVNEIESILQSTGFRREECHKVAAELASAGARDMRTVVQLLQQDNATLAKAGLHPSHVLRVLRNMAKQPVFAAEAPSFRLKLDDD
jgi:hypothetical protein